MFPVFPEAIPDSLCSVHVAPWLFRTRPRLVPRLARVFPTFPRAFPACAVLRV
jgi:hypothetical protein